VEKLARGIRVLVWKLAVSFAGAHLADPAVLAFELRPGSRAHPGDQVLEGEKRLGGERFQHLRAGSGFAHSHGDLLHPGVRVIALEVNVPESRDNTQQVRVLGWEELVEIWHGIDNDILQGNED
jgi:hypothetical protein